METNSLKNIIVLKSLPSNIIEEAIIILKSNKYAKKFQTIEKKSREEQSKIEVNKKEYIIKEAEAILSSYVSKIESDKSLAKPNKSLKNKYERLKKYSYIITVSLVISLILNFI
jgi:hypothetical protein